jgi:3-isopropylmalate/(R)-2-methylmalate dehydratase small subunit
MEQHIRGKAFVVGDDIDTDQIIPAEHLMYDPGDPEERKHFGEFALSGVPSAQSGLPDGEIPFTPEGSHESEYDIIIGGTNFGCGSSREHAPLAISVAGVKAVVAEFFARIFYRNSVNGGYILPLEAKSRLVEKIRTGDDVEIDLASHTLTDHTTGERFELKPLGQVAPIVEAGGVFEYAKQVGMLKR